ncbi:MAG: lysophospholipid acyltransferase family protein [Chloroflexota bacterium]
MAAWTIPKLPEAWLPPLARFLGTAAFIAGVEARRTAQGNIRPVVGRAASGRVAHRMFVHNAQYYLSLFAPRPRHFSLMDHQLDGWEAFGQALAAGRGCILVSPHLGDINYYAELFVASGFRVNVLVEDLKPKRLSDLVVALRERRGVHVIVGGKGALREVYRALDRNEIVAIISDRDVAGDGYPARLFGREIRMPGTAFTIGARRKTPVVFGMAVRLRGNRIVADVRPPFVPSADVPAHVAEMARVFEQFISRFPDQWLAFQPLSQGAARARPNGDLDG